MRKKPFLKARNNLWLLRGNEKTDTEHTLCGLKARKKCILRQERPIGHQTGNKWQKGRPYAAGFPMLLAGQAETYLRQEGNPVAGKVFPRLHANFFDYYIASAKNHWDYSELFQTPHNPNRIAQNNGGRGDVWVHPTLYRRLFRPTGLKPGVPWAEQECLMKRKNE